MASERNKAKAMHLPGKTFSNEEEEYIIDLKEHTEPALDWATLTARFNARFPESARSKGGLQVHYSRSLKPGQVRRPNSRRSRRQGNISEGADAVAGGDDSDTEDADFATQYNSFHQTLGHRISSTIPTPESVISNITYQSTRREIDPLHLRAATDLDSPFFRDVAQIGHTRQARRIRKSYAESNSDISDDDPDQEEIDPDETECDLDQANDVPDMESERSDLGTEGERSDDEIMQDENNTGNDTNGTVPGTVQNRQTRIKKLSQDKARKFAKGYGVPGGVRRPWLEPREARKRKGVTEPDIPREQPWEVCKQGHEAWERARQQEPNLPRCIKWPPSNKVVEWSPRNGSLRVRLRNNRDPALHLTRGGPIWKRPALVNELNDDDDNIPAHPREILAVNDRTVIGGNNDLVDNDYVKIARLCPRAATDPGPELDPGNPTLDHEHLVQRAISTGPPTSP